MSDTPSVEQLMRQQRQMLVEFAGLRDQLTVLITMMTRISTKLDALRDEMLAEQADDVGPTLSQQLEDELRGGPE